MDTDLWRLPGPRSYVEDISDGVERHIAAVLPAALADSSLFADSLAVAIIDRITHRGVPARRVHPEDAKSVLETMHKLCWDPPSTIPDLLRHDELVGTVAVLSNVDLSESARDDLPRFLERVERESRSLPPSERLTIVTIGSRQQLPTFAGGATSEVGFTSVWFWGRISRWDVASHIAAFSRERRGGVIQDVRAETIVEVASWDLAVAEFLVENWSGDPVDLPEALGDAALPIPQKQAGWFGATEVTMVPPPAVLRAWDERVVDAWHERIHPGPSIALLERQKLDRIVWSAQARVLLPWIEQNRVRLHSEVRRDLGRNFAAHVDAVLPGHSPNGLIEIGPLERLVRTRGSLGYLYQAARELKRARNALAHLRPLSLMDQCDLVDHCAGRAGAQPRGGGTRGRPRGPAGPSGGGKRA
ncbi:hypothetical protein, partial [Nocardia xishanensis]|uniref:hypothetical protein n=1 Tax=Nocardia xishanensis TaxID=238964 RepID=UPI00341D2647